MPDENKLFNCSRDGSCFADQNDSGTPSASRESSEMRRHRPPILAHENPPGVGGDPQDFWISQASKGGIASGANVNLRRYPSQPAQDATVQIGVSLEYDSHAAPAVAWQSIRRWFVSIGDVATLRRAAPPPSRRQSPSGSPGKTQGRRALARVLRLDSFRPCPRPTDLREKDRPANPERSSFLQPGIRLRRLLRIPLASIVHQTHRHTMKAFETSGS
jgi:hypothetical protein